MQSFFIFGMFLFQILFWFGVIFTAFLFFKFNSIKGWFNKRAGETIVESFSFRQLRTVFISILIGWIIAFGTVLVLGVSFDMDANVLDRHMMLIVGVPVVLALIYPTWRIVRRVKLCMVGNNKKALVWRMVYDGVVNLAFWSGGLFVGTVLTFATVIMSLTRWKDVMPNRLRQFAGVDVVPQTTRFYWVGVVTAVGALLLELFSGHNGDNLVGGIAVVVCLVFVGYVWWRVHTAAPEQKKQIAWQWGYMAVATYVVFLITVFLIYLALILFVVYGLLSYWDSRSPKNDRYSVSCDNLTDDIINGRGICSITGSRCEARDTGSCPYR